MDFKDAFASLADRYPQWTDQIRLLPLKDSLSVRPVDNDGHTIYYNSRLMSYYTDETRIFYAAQQLLHVNLSHFARGKGRDPAVWKRASDAVANAMLRSDGFVLPEDTVSVPDAGSKSAEDWYDVFLAEAHEQEKKAEVDPEKKDGEPDPDKTGKKAGKESEAHSREIEDPGLAAIVSGLSEMLEPSLQMDFDWFPGTTIRDGVLSHEFRPYPVAHAEILLDTSASVDADLLRAFVRGVKGLMRQDSVIRVGCFDTRFYGFQDVTNEEDIRNLTFSGSGGTDFHAAVNAFTGDAENKIIFTDGFAEMPEQRCDAIWVVYGNAEIHPNGGRVIYSRPPEEKEKHEIDFLIT